MIHSGLGKVQFIINCILLSFIFAQLSACGTNASAELPIDTVEFTEILAGDTPIGVTVMTRKAEVFNDQSSFTTELYQYAQFFVPVEFDFSKQQVVLVRLQQFSNGGYDIKVKQVEEFEKYIAATIEITYPGEGCITTTSLSAPYQFVSLASIKPVIFLEQFIETAC